MRFIILFVFLIFLSSCANYQGPISKKEYKSKEDPGYKQELLEQSRKDFVSSHPDLTKRQKQAILSGELLKGMTRSQVQASWGAPYSIYRSVTGSIVNEQWVYINFDPMSGEQMYYLNFKDSLLQSWFF